MGAAGSRPAAERYVDPGPRDYRVIIPCLVGCHAVAAPVGGYDKSFNVNVQLLDHW